MPLFGGILPEARRRLPISPRTRLPARLPTVGRHAIPIAQERHQPRSSLLPARDTDRACLRLVSPLVR